MLLVRRDCLDFREPKVNEATAFRELEASLEYLDNQECPGEWEKSAGQVPTERRDSKG